jgi:hypothetical protein
MVLRNCAEHNPMKSVRTILLTAVMAVAVLGGTVAFFWDHGRTNNTAFDPVMP